MLVFGEVVVGAVGWVVLTVTTVLTVTAVLAFAVGEGVGGVGVFVFFFVFFCGVGCRWPAIRRPTRARQPARGD